MQSVQLEREQGRCTTSMLFLVGKKQWNYSEDEGPNLAIESTLLMKTWWIQTCILPRHYFNWWLALTLFKQPLQGWVSVYACKRDECRVVSQGPNTLWGLYQQALHLSEEGLKDLALACLEDSWLFGVPDISRQMYKICWQVLENWSIQL